MVRKARLNMNRENEFKMVKQRAEKGIGKDRKMLRKRESTERSVCEEREREIVRQRKYEKE